MPQIFTATADTRLRAAMLMGVIVLFGFCLLVGGYMTSSYASLVGWIREQPVPFSHEHHVDGLGIAMWFGFFTSYPINWWLIRKGIKEKM